MLPTLASDKVIENNGQKGPPRGWAMGQGTPPVKQDPGLINNCPAGFQDNYRAVTVVCLPFFLFPYGNVYGGYPLPGPTIMYAVWRSGADSMFQIIGHLTKES